MRLFLGIRAVYHLYFPLFAGVLILSAQVHAGELPALRDYLGGLVLPQGSEARAGDFVLVQSGQVVPVWLSEAGEGPVGQAASDLSEDLHRVTGLSSGAPVRTNPGVPCVLVGLLGRGGLVDRLVAEGKLEVSGIAGAWEAGVIQVVEQPVAGVERALVVAGSDERGAIYSLYDLSRALGVSPWHWWADVPVGHRDAPRVASGAHKRGAPAVRYRGIFINDEDWGLQAWAAKTFEPEAGGIGPRTYDKVCELLLRLRANTLWPAMHACTPAFNENPANRAVAGRRGIVMGSSHAEPLLRNNVREWTGDKALYDFGLNEAGVSAYWEERVQSNAAYENLWTLGMRGIHDSAMQGVHSVQEQARRLEKIFETQRALLDRHVAGGAAKAPQVFCAYKEVLEVYRSGLQVPEEVTLLWPDDNFGYVRNFPTREESARAGRSGVYYHISYLGRPLSYLWLCTTPPALVWEEMTRAYRAGADRLWVVNVGDIKPAEITLEYFLNLAWEAQRSGPETAAAFLREWAGREFGAANAEEVASLLESYYRFNALRKPEHLQGWVAARRSEPLLAVPVQWEGLVVKARLEEARKLASEALRLADKIPPAGAASFFELVTYPVCGAAEANQRYFALDQLKRLPEGAAERAVQWASLALAANTRLEERTRYYNERLLGGKWNGLLSLEPADQQWASMRLEAPDLSAALALVGEAGEAAGAKGAGGEFPSVVESSIQRPAPSFLSPVPPESRPEGAGWVVVPGLGHSGRALALMPPSEEKAGPLYAPYSFLCAPLAAPRGDCVLSVALLPTQGLVAGAKRSLVVQLDGRVAGVIEIPAVDGGPEWSRAVLEGRRVFQLQLTLAGDSPHTFVFSSTETGLVVDELWLQSSVKQDSP